MTDFSDVRRRVEAAWADPETATQDDDAIGAIRGVVAALDRGELRAAVKTKEGWRSNEWVRQAILLFFKISQMDHLEVGPFEYYDKIPLKHGLERAGVRVVPPGVARYGSFLESGAILMPGYVNIGARVGAGTLVDTWATVGSCAQVGRNVHLSGGVGIGGVLEPTTAMPVVVEDDCFIGSRCVLVEGVIVEEGAVLGANVVITSSTPILDVTGPTEKQIKGRVPAGSVVVPGTRARQFPAGSYQLPCALIIGQRSASTDKKTSLNEVLRQFALPT
jgi:2,3,4,5-tetrahydropyridine-2,6-dicarboxylate N-succinyltransferase